MKVDLFLEGIASIDLRELGRTILVKVSCCIKIPKSPNWLWIIENSNFLIFDKILLKQDQALGCIYTTIKLATNILEYVPTSTPMIKANEKYRMTSPPKK